MLAVGSSAMGRRAEAILASASEFAVVARATTGEALAAYCRGLSPDVVVLDERLDRGECVRVVARLALERPLPTVLLVDEASGMTLDADSARRVRITRVSRRSLDDDHGASYFRTQLRLAATRGHESKQTITGPELSAVIEELLDDEDRSDSIPAHLQALLQRPLELVVLAGGRAGLPALDDAIGRLRTLRVPVLIALDDLLDATPLVDAASRRGLYIRMLEQTAAVRRLSGLWLASIARPVRVDGGALVVGGPGGVALGPGAATADGGLDVPALVQSLAPLGQHALVVALPSGRRDARTALKVAAGAGVGVAELGLVSVPAPRGGFPVLDPHDLAAVLEGARPLRV